MKSYSQEYVLRRSGSGTLGKIAITALVGIGAYYGYKWYKKDDKNEKTNSEIASGSYDLDAQEGEAFTDRVLRAARRIIK